jgi:hypothetical protein
MNNFHRTALAALLCTLTVNSAIARPVTEKPNIIFILLDDLGKEWISCYGGEGIETPNIDQCSRFMSLKDVT